MFTLESEFSEKVLHVFQNFVNKVCNINSTYRGFPGGQPVSLNKNTILDMRRFYRYKLSEYVVSFKADGKRAYLGFLCVDGKFYSFFFFRSGVFLPAPVCLHKLAYEGTLFDVEILEMAKKVVIFDVCCVYGNVCASEFYPNRLEIAKYFLKDFQKSEKASYSLVPTVPQAQLQSNLKDLEYDVNQWKVKVKSIFYTSKINFLPKNWIYDDDGFIFTLCSEPFFVYTNQNKASAVLKWKPPKKITIDVLISSQTCQAGEIQTVRNTIKNNSLFSCLKLENFIVKKGSYNIYAADQDHLVFF
jgi:hypothetical protein